MKPSQLFMSIIDPASLLFHHMCIYSRTSHSLSLLMGIASKIIQTRRDIIAFLNSWIRMILQQEQPVDSRANARLINQIWEGACNEKAPKDADTRTAFPRGPGSYHLSSRHSLKVIVLNWVLFVVSLRDTQNDKTSARSCERCKMENISYFILSQSLLHVDYAFLPSNHSCCVLILHACAFSFSLWIHLECSIFFGCLISLAFFLSSLL